MTVWGQYIPKSMETSTQRTGGWLPASSIYPTRLSASSVSAFVMPCSSTKNEIHARTHTHVYIYIYRNVYVYVYVYVYAYVYVYVYVYV